MKILAIDDQQDNLTTLKAVAADALPEAKVLTALSGPAGIKLARTEDPDVILLDIIMPGMDGFAVCRELKADDHLRTIPVIFLTALRTDKQSRMKAVEAGAEAFLTKPLDEVELTAQVRAMSKIREANRLQQRATEQLSSLVVQRTGELEQQVAELRQTETALQETCLQLKHSQLATLGLLDKQQAAATALRDSEERYRSLFAKMQEGFALHEIICDGRGRPCDYRFLEINAAFETLTGLRAADIQGKRVLEVLPAIEAGWIEKYGQVALTGEAVEFEDYSAALEKHFKVTAFSPRPHQFATLFSDITTRKQAEAVVQTSESRLRAITDAVRDALLMMDTKGLISFWNPAAERIFGYTSDEVLGRDLHRLLAPTRHHATYHAAFPTFLQTGLGNAINKTLELHACRKNGEEFPVELSLSALRRDDGWHAVGLLRDITERKQAEAKQAEQLNELRRWREATLGRELRMMELKREINDLLAMAGQPPRYAGVEQSKPPFSGHG